MFMKKFCPQTQTGAKLYKVNLNLEPGMTFTYFTARVSIGALAFEWGKLF